MSRKKNLAYTRVPVTHIIWALFAGRHCWKVHLPRVPGSELVYPVAIGVHIPKIFTLAEFPKQDHDPEK
jgi:hypothetical protein